MTPRSDAAARRLLEWLVWPDGRRLHCDGKTSWPPNGGHPGLYECAGCHRQFTVTTRTPLHATKLPIATWLEAASPVLASSKGVSSLALARHLGITQRSAWKLKHALRLLMRPGAYEPPLGGIVEIDALTDGGNPARRNRARYGRAMAKHIYNPPGRATRPLLPRETPDLPGEVAVEAGVFVPSLGGARYVVTLRVQRRHGPPRTDPHVVTHRGDWVRSRKGALRPTSWGRFMLSR